MLVWTIPAEGFGKDTENITAPALEFAGHNRKVGHVLFNPVAENVLLSSAADLLIKLYDVQKGSEKQSIQGHPDIINSVAYNYNGSIVATCCKDKKVRLVDVRDGKIVQEADAHQGVKGSRACWLGDSNYLITTGFSKSCDRQLMIWDGRMMDAPVKSENLDTSSGILMPHYDNDTKMLYLAGKGDGNIRYWEFAEEAPFTHYLSDFKSSDPQRGVAFLPKRACNVGECEVARVFKVHPDRIEPISFKVPRKSDQFQSDIFPDTIGDAPSLSADEWFGGKNADPKLISLENGFQPSAKKEFQTEAFAGKSGKASSESKLLSSEKDYQDAYHQLRKENEALKNEIAQKDVRLRQLELQLEQLSSK